MSSISCNICFETFCEFKCIPKVLECGHTVCSTCLKILLQSQKACPTCKSTLTKSLEEYPTNFIVFETMDTITETKCSSMIRILKDMENVLLLRRDIILKSIWERTKFKNTITNGIARIQQMLEMDEDILNLGDIENLVSELEVEVNKIDEVLYCCSNSNLSSSYSINDYKNSTFFLYDLANRLYKGEKLYAHEMVHNSKLKFGELTLENDKINVHALTLSSVHRNASVIAFQDIRNCITTENFRTFIEIGEKKIHFIIIDSSFLALRFIKLCSGETGPTFKGASGTTPPKAAVKEIPTRVIYNNRVTPVQQNIIQNEHIFIEKYMLNDVETEGFNDYDMNFFLAEKETSYSIGETIVQMFPKGPCNIHKCVTGSLNYKNVVATMEKECNVTLYRMNPAVISDSGISLIINI